MASGVANGLLLLDVSDFQSRKANPAMRTISTLVWDDGSRGAQNALPISIGGKPYILFTDESGAARARRSAAEPGSRLTDSRGSSTSAIRPIRRRAAR